MVPLVILDVSRTLSRLHHGHATGIDRVESAYLHWLSDKHPGSKVVAKIGSEYLFASLSDFAEFLSPPKVYNQIGILDRFRLKLSPAQRAVKTAIRRRFGWIGQNQFHLRLAKLPKGSRYINVGHSRSLGDDWKLLRQHGFRNTFLIHDLIPLTHPEFSRGHIPKNFAKFIMDVNATATDLIFVSDYSRSVSERHFKNIDKIVSSPGIENTFLNVGPRKPNPFVLAVGTIEPRKNYDLLVDLWKSPPRANDGEELRLKIVGQIGWESGEVISEIRRLEEQGKLDLLTDTSDQSLAELYVACHALVFPSFVEGFGLPLYEACSAKAPILASDIPAFQSLKLSGLKLLDPLNQDAWRNALKNPSDYICSAHIPTWEEHFERVGL